MTPRRRWNRSKRSLLLLIPFLCLESTSAQHEFSHSRELALECPTDEGFDETGNSASETYEGLPYSKGAYGRGLIEKMRTKPKSYYQNIVNNTIMLICDVDIASERCVEETSANAAKDWQGKCLQAADFHCPAGTCERTSNCYWNSVYEGQNRTTRFVVGDYDKAAKVLYGNENSYAREMTQIGAIGIVIALLLLFFWFIFFIARYLCCCLWIPCSSVCFICSPIPRKHGYSTCRHVVFPAFLYVLSLVGIIAAGAMAFIGNEDISVALSNTFLHADGLVEDLGAFLGRSKIPLVNIEGIVDDAALEAKSIFDGTEYVKEDAMMIVSSFLGYFDLHSSGLNASNAMANFDSASTSFETKVSPITDNVQDMLDTLELDLYDKADLIKTGLMGALDQLDSFSGQSLEWQRIIYDYEAKELGVRDVRKAGVMAIFLLSLLFSLVGFMGILVAKKRSRISSLFSFMVKVAGFFSAVLGTVSLVVASISLCLSFLLHDACQISSLVTADFEPFVGDKVSPGANACFNDTNLAVAFNVTDKVDFQQKLEQQLQQIEKVNVTDKFQLVLEPLNDIQSMLGTLSDTALSALNQATNINTDFCPFTDTYTKATIISPWENDRDAPDTPYSISDNLGNPTSYGRIGLENGEAYLERIYDITGVCSGGESCCIRLTATPPTTCESQSTYAACDYGSNCQYPCDALADGIVEGYKAFVELYEKELAMTADLGVVCPADFAGSCPTDEFKVESKSNQTLVDMLSSYKGKIVLTKDSLVNLASTSVGDTMDEVEDFLCNMNVSFVEKRYDEVKDDICGTLFGGVAQINWSLWLLGISLEAAAILAHLLIVRLRGSSEKEASYSQADIYG